MSVLDRPTFKSLDVLRHTSLGFHEEVAAPNLWPENNPRRSSLEKDSIFLGLFRVL